VPQKSALKLVAGQSLRRCDRRYFYFDVNNLPAFENVWPLGMFQEKPGFAATSTWNMEARIARGATWNGSSKKARCGAGIMTRRGGSWSRNEIRDALMAQRMKLAATFDATLFFQNDPFCKPGYRTFYLARYIERMRLSFPALLIANLGAQQLPSVEPAQAGLSKERLARIAPLMNKRSKANRMSGAIGMCFAMARLLNSNLTATWTGNREADAQGYIFRMYSMTKGSRAWLS